MAIPILSLPITTTVDGTAGWLPVAIYDGQSWVLKRVLFQTAITTNMRELFRSLDNGSSSDPSISFLASPETGVFSPSENEIAITTDGEERLLADEDGNVVVGQGALSTSATDGFLYVAACQGPPTGLPVNYGATPLVVDEDASILYIYVNGSWDPVLAE